MFRSPGTHKTKRNFYLTATIDKPDNPVRILLQTDIINVLGTKYDTNNDTFPLKLINFITSLMCRP